MDSDYELLYLAQEDIENTVNYLYKKYNKLIYSKVIKYSSSNKSFEDYLNIAKLSLYNAVENYRDDYPFLAYLNVCLERSLSNYKKTLSRNKYKILDEAISFDNEDISINNLVGDERYNPEKILYEESSYLSFKEKLLKKLTWKEELILNLKEQNYTNKEISEITDNNLRTVYNIINRIKNKVSNIVSNKDK